MEFLYSKLVVFAIMNGCFLTGPSLGRNKTFSVLPNRDSAESPTTSRDSREPLSGFDFCIEIPESGGERAQRSEAQRPVSAAHLGSNSLSFSFVISFFCGDCPGFLIQFSRTSFFCNSLETLKEVPEFLYLQLTLIPLEYLSNVSILGLLATVILMGELESSPRSATFHSL